MKTLKKEKLTIDEFRNQKDFELMQTKPRALGLAKEMLVTRSEAKCKRL